MDNLKYKRYSLAQVLSEHDTEYALEQVKKELERKPLRNGGQIRIIAMKSIVDSLDSINKKLNVIYELLIDINKKGESHD